MQRDSCRTEATRKLHRDYNEAAERTNHLCAKFQASHVATQTLAVHGKLPPGSEYDAKQIGKRTDKLVRSATQASGARGCEGGWHGLALQADALALLAQMLTCTTTTCSPSSRPTSTRNTAREQIMPALLGCSTRLGLQVGHLPRRGGVRGAVHANGSRAGPSQVGT